MPSEQGVVKFFKVERGWGAVSVPSLPEGTDVWFHHTAWAEDRPGPSAGAAVEVEYAEADQNSFRYKALSVRPA